MSTTESKMRPATLRELRELCLGDRSPFTEEFPMIAYAVLDQELDEALLKFSNGRALHVSVNGLHEKHPYVILEMGWDPEAERLRYVHSTRGDTFFAFKERHHFEQYIREFSNWKPIEFDGKTLEAKNGQPQRLGSSIFWRRDREVSIAPDSLWTYANQIMVSL